MLQNGLTTALLCLVAVDTDAQERRRPESYADRRRVTLQHQGLRTSDGLEAAPAATTFRCRDPS